MSADCKRREIIRIFAKRSATLGVFFGRGSLRTIGIWVLRNIELKKTQKIKENKIKEYNITE